MQQELQSKCKRGEEEIKKLKEQIAVQKREVEVERQQLEFKVQEAQKAENMLRGELSELRVDRERKLTQH